MLITMPHFFAYPVNVEVNVSNVFTNKNLESFRDDRNVNFTSKIGNVFIDQIRGPTSRCIL